MTGGTFRRLCLGLALSLLATPALAASRGIEVELRASERAGAPVSETVRLYGNSYALVIGIDRYTAGWPRLANAVKDAEVVAAELTARGFEARLEIDLDSRALQDTLKEFFALKGADPEARLLLWFTGHGQTLNGEGFLVPADAPPVTNPGFKLKAFPMRDFGGLMRLARAKHVLSIFDSCFSGTVFTVRSGAASPAITRKTTEPVRQFLTSCDAGQQVRDDGSFRGLFVRALRGDETADANRDGYLTGEELGLFLSQRLAALTDAAQTPRYGKLQDVRYDRGDFVFALPGGTVAGDPGSADQQAGATGAVDRDALFWQSIKDSEYPADYKAYLEAFPKGTFAPLARLRARRGEQRTALVAPPPPIELEPVEAEYVVVKNANVREEPTVRSAKRTTLRRGTSVHVAGKVKGRNWYLVERDDKRLGFVFGNLLKDAAVFKRDEAARQEQERLDQEAEKKRLEEEQRKAEAERQRQEELRQEEERIAELKRRDVPIMNGVEITNYSDCLSYSEESDKMACQYALSIIDVKALLFALYWYYPNSRLINDKNTPLFRQSLSYMQSIIGIAPTGKLSLSTGEKLNEARESAIDWTNQCGTIHVIAKFLGDSIVRL